MGAQIVASFDLFFINNIIINKINKRSNCIFTLIQERFSIDRNTAGAE